MAKKKPTIRNLKARAWKTFSEWIRRKDADEGGTTVCFTCNRPIHWKYEAQAGHAIGGRRNAVLLDEDIVRPQCYACNAKHIGNGRPEVFVAKLIKAHGMDWWENKLSGARAVVKLTRGDYEGLIEVYKDKLKGLE